MAADEVGLQAQALARQADRLVVVAADELRVGGDAAIDRCAGVARAQPERPARREVAVFPTAAIGQRQPIEALGQREAGIELQGELELGQAVVEATGEQQGVAQRMMCPRVLAVGANRRPRRALGDRHGGRHVLPTHVGGEGMAGRQHAQRLAVVGIDADRLLEQRLRHDIVLPRDAPVVGQSPHDEVPGIEAVGRATPGVRAFRGVELRLDGGHDGLRDLVLDGEDIGQRAIVALRPDMAAGGDRIELGGDSHAIARLADAALHDIAHAEFAADLGEMDGAVLVDERGVAGDHVDPAQPRQRRDDVLADAVGKVFLLGLAAHVDEGQDGDAQAVERRRMAGCRARCGGRRGWRGRRPGILGDHADEAEALAGQGSYQPLVLAIVPHRLARGIDAAGQGRFRHHPSLPDGLDEVVLADHAVAVLHQVGQQVEHLRLDLEAFLPAQELAPAGIQHMIGEVELHAIPCRDVGK
jgi:hypothetical protein